MHVIGFTDSIDELIFKSIVHSIHSIQGKPDFLNIFTGKAKFLFRLNSMSNIET